VPARHRTITAVEHEPIGRDAPPTMPSRTAFLLSFVSVIVAGVFGGIIGYGLVDISSVTSTSSERLLGALVGAVVAAGGIGIVAVLVLRAMAEWRRGKTR
jgi:hypothetical protein